MISNLSGEVAHIGTSNTVICVKGLGFCVELTQPHAASLSVGDEISIPTAMIVRQESLTIYGFAGHDERTLFEQLISVTGIGPRHAIAALSTFDVGELARAIQADDDAVFRKVPGIGPKTARMIVMSLRTKITGLVQTDAEPQNRTSVETPARLEAANALLALGWKQKVADDALNAVFDENPTAESLSTAMLIRAALAQLR